MSRLPAIRFFVVSLLLCFGSVSSAETIELQVTGQITVSTFASVPAGTTLTADLFYDPTVATSDSGDYPVPQQAVLDFAGSTLTSPTGSDVTVILNNTTPGFFGIPGGNDGIYWLATPTSADATGPITSDPGFDADGFSSFNIYFAAPTGTVVTSAVPPTPFPALSQWTTAAFYYVPITGSCTETGTCGDFDGTITSLEVVNSSPEPSTAFLSALSLIALLARRCIRTVATRV